MDTANLSHELTLGNDTIISYYKLNIFTIIITQYPWTCLWKSISMSMKNILVYHPHIVLYGIPPKSLMFCRSIITIDISKFIMCEGRSIIFKTKTNSVKQKKNLRSEKLIGDVTDSRMTIHNISFCGWPLNNGVTRFFIATDYKEYCSCHR